MGGVRGSGSWSCVEREPRFPLCRINRVEPAAAGGNGEEYLRPPAPAVVWKGIAIHTWGHLDCDATKTTDPVPHTPYNVVSYCGACRGVLPATHFPRPLQNPPHELAVSEELRKIFTLGTSVPARLDSRQQLGGVLYLYLGPGAVEGILSVCLCKTLKNSTPLLTLCTLNCVWCRAAFFVSHARSQVRPMCSLIWLIVFGAIGDGSPRWRWIFACVKPNNFPILAASDQESTCRRSATPCPPAILRLVRR